jgi:hypothetical protein
MIDFVLPFVTCQYDSSVAHVSPVISPSQYRGYGFVIYVGTAQARVIYEQGREIYIRARHKSPDLLPRDVISPVKLTSYRSHARLEVSVVLYGY